LWITTQQHSCVVGYSGVGFPLLYLTTEEVSSVVSHNGDFFLLWDRKRSSSFVDYNRDSLRMFDNFSSFVSQKAGDFLPLYHTSEKNLLVVSHNEEGSVPS
jgi:hypothetical protein